MLAQFQNTGQNCHDTTKNSNYNLYVFVVTLFCHAIARKVFGLNQVKVMQDISAMIDRTPHREVDGGT